MHLQTKQQKLYYEEVIRLHKEYGYVAIRISRILPIGHTTVSRWLAIFAAEKSKKFVQKEKTKTQSPAHPAPACTQVNEVRALQRDVSRLQSELKSANLRADAYDEMINVAESKFNIVIRKKAGVKR
jgi:uncharacterized protein YlxW (UPF0749 family)